MKKHTTITRRLLCLFYAVALLLSAAVFVSAEETDYGAYFDDVEDTLASGADNADFYDGMYTVFTEDTSGFMDELAFRDARVQQQIIDGLVQTRSDDTLNSMRGIIERIKDSMGISVRNLRNAFLHAVYWELGNRYIQGYRTDYDAMFREVWESRDGAFAQSYHYRLEQSLKKEPADFLANLARQSKKTQERVVREFRDSSFDITGIQIKRAMDLQMAGGKLTQEQLALAESIRRVLHTVPDFQLATGPDAYELAVRNGEAEPTEQETTPPTTEPDTTEPETLETPLAYALADVMGKLDKGEQGNAANTLFGYLMRDPRAMIEELAYQDAGVKQQLMEILVYELPQAKIYALKELFNSFRFEGNTGMGVLERNLVEVYFQAMQLDIYRRPESYRTDYNAMFGELKPNEFGNFSILVGVGTGISLEEAPIAFIKALAKQDQTTQENVVRYLTEYLNTDVQKLRRLVVCDELKGLEEETRLFAAELALLEQLRTQIEPGEFPYMLQNPTAQMLEARKEKYTPKSEPTEPEPTETEPVPTESQPAVEDPKPESGAGIWIALGAVLAAAALGFLLGRKKKAA